MRRLLLEAVLHKCQWEVVQGPPWYAASYSPAQVQGEVIRQELGEERPHWVSEEGLIEAEFLHLAMTRSDEMNILLAGP